MCFRMLVMFIDLGLKRIPMVMYNIQLNTLVALLI